MISSTRYDVCLNRQGCTVNLGSLDCSGCTFSIIEICDPISGSYGSDGISYLELSNRKQLRPKGRRFVVEFLPLPLSCFDEVPLTCGKSFHRVERRVSTGFSPLWGH